MGQAVRAGPHPERSWTLIIASSSLSPVSWSVTYGRGGGHCWQGLLPLVPSLAGGPFPMAVKVVVAAPGVLGVLCQVDSRESLRGELGTQ